MSARSITVKKPIVTNTVANFIDDTIDDRLIDVLIHTELRQTAEGTNSEESVEVANYVNNCLAEFVLAREYGYNIK